MKKKSKFFWIYSIALFSIAFILILFSAFTGIRYKTEHNQTRNLYMGAQTSIITLTDQNEALTRDNQEKQRQLDSLTQQNSELNNNLQKTAEEKEKLSDTMEKLLQVQELLTTKKYSEARELFDTLDGSVLGKYGQALYEKTRKRFK